MTVFAEWSFDALLPVQFAALRAFIARPDPLAPALLSFYQAMLTRVRCVGETFARSRSSPRDSWSRITQADDTSDRGHRRASNRTATRTPVQEAKCGGKGMTEQRTEALKIDSFRCTFLCVGRATSAICHDCAYVCDAGLACERPGLSTAREPVRPPSLYWSSNPSPWRGAHGTLAQRLGARRL